MLRIDTRNPPGNEHLVGEYVERVRESELYRFVRFNDEVVADLARAR